MAPETVEVTTGFGEPNGADELGETIVEPVPIEVLERRLTSVAAHIAAAEAEWLGWLGEYCVREGWDSWGCSGPVQWLSWQCGMSPSTAREKVRVALALRELPVIFEHFAQGRLSYSKVRALTRVATPANDWDLAELGVAATGAKLDLIVRSYRRALDADKPARSAWCERSWRSRAVDEESTVFTLRVPNDQAEYVQRAVTIEVDRVIDDAIGIDGDATRNDIIESRGGWAAIRADAAVALLNGTARTDVVLPAEVDLCINADAHDQHSSVSPATNAPAEAPPSSRPAVHDDTCAADLDDTTSVSPATNAPAEAPPLDDLDIGHRGRAVAPTVGRRLCCDPRIAALIEDSRGGVLGAGRRTRLVSRKLRRAVERRDNGCCRFPGCAATRRLHAHHIIHWADGGPTELDNLILLCTFHHHVVHEGGWRIDSVTHAFITPAGSAADERPTTRHGGNVGAVTSTRRFASTAPLAEAENMPFDLGLVLEGLAFDDADSKRTAADLRSAYPPRTVTLGPPIPTDLHRRRQVEAHWNRHRTQHWPSERRGL